MKTEEKERETVQKLLNMWISTDNRHEAEAFLQKATAIMVKHGWKRSEFDINLKNPLTTYTPNPVAIYEKPKVKKPTKERVKQAGKVLWVGTQCVGIAIVGIVDLGLSLIELPVNALVKKSDEERPVHYDEPRRKKRVKVYIEAEDDIDIDMKIRM